MFSVLPLVFFVSTSSVLSVSLMTAAALSPKNGKPPPGVAVARVTWVWALAAFMRTALVSATRNAIRARVIGSVRLAVMEGFRRLNLPI